MAAFTIERIDPSQLNTPMSYTAAYIGNAVPAVLPRVAEEPQPEPRQARAPKAHAKIRAKIPVLEVATTLAMFVLVLALIFSYVRLNEISTDAAELRDQLFTLREEEKTLRNQYHTAYDLKTVEDQAVNTLGMTSPDGSQIVYLTLQREDKAEILAKDNYFANFLRSITRAFTIALEYFQQNRSYSVIAAGAK